MVRDSEVTRVIIPSRGWRGFPWGMAVVITIMLGPLFAATFLSIRAYEAWWWYLAAAWLAGGYLVVVAVTFAFAPSEVEYRDDGLYARYWWGHRVGDWSLLQPSRRRWSVWQGFQLNEPMGDGSWRHFLLTREQARAALRDPRLLRRDEASDRVLASLGLNRQDVRAR